MSIDIAKTASVRSPILSPRCMEPYPSDAPFPGVKHHDLNLLTRKDEPLEGDDVVVIDSEALHTTCLNSIFTVEGGGFHPFEKGDEIFHIGIIDMLTFYGTAKKIAHTFKTVLWQPEELSTVEARYYATRFMNYFQEIFPRGPPPDQPEITAPSTVTTEEVNFINEVVTGNQRS